MPDISELADRLSAAKTLVRMAVFNGIQRAGLLVEGDAKRLCPVGETGRLRGSINTQVESTADSVQASVGTNAEYAHYVEYGTGQRGDPAVDHRVDWAGTPPHPFLRPALQFNKDSGNINLLIDAEIAKVLK